jgi:transcriptional regulator GlxA family with amidase domain
MQIAIVTFDGFNELDSFIASALINRAGKAGVTAYITTPTATVTSLNGVTVTGQRPLEFIAEADAVLIGSGIRTRDVVANPALLDALPLDPGRQLIGSQCSGALVLAKLGLLGSMPVCTDTTSRPFVEDCGVTVLDAPFHAEGSIATAGGCLASQYLAAWAISRTVGDAAARAAIDYAAPVGEKDTTVQHVMATIQAGRIAAGSEFTSVH